MKIGKGGEEIGRLGWEEGGRRRSRVWRRRDLRGKGLKSKEQKTREAIGKEGKYFFRTWVDMEGRRESPICWN